MPPQLLESVIDCDLISRYLDELQPAATMAGSISRAFSITCKWLGIEGLRPVLEFEGTAKGLLINATNGGPLVCAYGNDMHLWAGMPVHLSITKFL